MQAIILAAGEGTRMRPLTNDTPKPLVRVLGKPLMEYNLEKLPPEITELIIVVGYLAEQIKQYFGNSYKNLPITYVHQEKLLGTADAVAQCEQYITGRFFVFMGDDLYAQEDFEHCLQNNQSWLVQKKHGAFVGGRIVVDTHENITDVIEGAHDVDAGYVSTNMFVLTPQYFDYEPVAIKDGAEFGLPQTVVQMSKKHPIKMVEAIGWRQVTTAVDIDALQQALSS